MRFIRHSAAIAVTSGVAVASLALPLGAAQGSVTKVVPQPTTNSPSATVAGYLARHLGGKNHDHYGGSYVYNGTTYYYVNDGQTADAVLSMDAAGVAQTAAARATAWLEKDAHGYLTGYMTGLPTEYPGAAAKLLLVASAQHVNPAKFGTTNLIAAITASEGVGGAAPGEYQQNPSSPSDSYIVSQALPIIALAGTTATSTEPDAAAVTFLAGQQCGNGGYESAIRDNAATTSCGTEDVDSTGYAIQALIAGGDRSDAVTALAWLAKQEHANGSFGRPGNANSTALAIQALVLAHRSVTRPWAWLAKIQVKCGGKPADRGAVPAAGKFSTATALLASSQAGAALALKPLAWIDKSGARPFVPTLSCPKK